MKPLITDTAWGARVMARYMARRIVEAELKDQGVRVTLTPPAVINALATEYIAKHPELIVEARERLERLEMRRR